MDEPIRIADQWYVLATSSRTDDRARILKAGETFGLFDRFGDIQHIGAGGQGLYHEGTRYLSRLELRVNDKRPMLLNSSVKQDNSALGVDLTTPDLHKDSQLVVLKGAVHMHREALLWDVAYHEHLSIANFGSQPVTLAVSLDFAADYADIFEVRGFRRARRGFDLEPAVLADSVRLAYRGLDNVSRRTTLHFSPMPTTLTANRVEYALALAPKARIDLYFTIGCDITPEVESFPIVRERARSALRGAQQRACSVYTVNEQFNQWLNRSAADLVMLTTDKVEGPYPYAGVPWYSTAFGRDGIITALQYLWANPSIARGVLGFLANNQATHANPENDAEPGKILHEVRGGELAALGEIPFGKYYGSVDSTPLYVVLAGAYLRRTGDVGFIRQIWPNVERCLEWIDRYGDRNGDGFIEYERRSASGLVQQGWKDSEDSVFHLDGELADAPVALAEVQGYVYRARLEAAVLAKALGQVGRAADLRKQALQLREAFEREFWCEDLGTYAMALDGARRQCRVRSSNAGQVLWSGIASRDRARRVADRLLDPSSFSGWGVRTIAEGESRYNPMSYHNGSIWPHDNALIAAGFARYGMQHQALQILTALFEASLFMDLHRLPELFGGFPRRAGEGPTLYPVACSPQAWASASVYYLLQACLGLSFSSTAPRIYFRHPLLPEYLSWLRITGLRIGEAAVDLEFRRHSHDVGVNVLRKEGNVEVAVIL